MRTTSSSQVRRSIGRVRRHANLGLVFLILLLLSVLVGAPFVYMISGSFKFNADIFSYPLTFIPKNPTLENYTRLLGGKEIPYPRQVFNSAVISINQTLLSLFVSSLVGWGFAKYDFRGKKILFTFLLATLMFPMQVALVPLFLLIVRFTLLDTYWAIILPGALSAFGVFLMRQTMLAVPDDLLDAARIDGSSEFGIYYRVGLPLAGPGLSVLAVLTFLGSWNDYLWPLIALRSAEKFTYPVGLSTLFGLYKIEYGMILAGAFLATLPILVIFVVGRKQFVAGLTAGAVKG